MAQPAGAVRSLAQGLLAAAAAATSWSGQLPASAHPCKPTPSALPSPALPKRRYNESLPAELGARIPVGGAAGQDALAVLIANSRAVWEPFVEACAARGLLQLDNPLEAYLEEAVCGALAAAAPG